MTGGTIETRGGVIIPLNILESRFGCMKKRIVLVLCTCGVAVLATLGLIYHHLYWHPVQHVGAWRSANVSYPSITFQPYNGLGLRTPALLREQSETFNQGVGAFAHEMTSKYDDDLTLEYALEYDDQGTDVIFTGQGRQVDGTVVDISKRLHFDLVIREDAKWN